MALKFIKILFMIKTLTIYTGHNSNIKLRVKIWKFFKHKPDLVLITVDRIETLGASIPASIMNFPILHIQGGEVTGTIDENIRHAVTKLSHIHMVANEDAKKRVVKIG